MKSKEPQKSTHYEKSQKANKINSQQIGCGLNHNEGK